MKSTIDVKVTTLTYGGEALGRLSDGRAVFVPYAIPGEKVRIRLVEEKRSYARAELVEVLDPAPERTLPRCIHFGICGGCHYQHLPYEQQLAAKRMILTDQLTRIGKLEGLKVEPTVASPNEYAYRNHIEFHLTPGGELGFHLAHSDQVFPVQECHLPEQLINQVWPQLDFETPLEIERVGLRCGVGEDVQLILESRDEDPPEFSLEDLDISAVHLGPNETTVLAGSDRVEIEVLGRSFQVSARSFFQVNTAMAEKMVAHVLEGIEQYRSPTPQMTVLDVYCGVGLFSAFLAPKVGRLIGIESEPAAVEDFVTNLDEFDHVEVFEASAEEVLSSLSTPVDLALVDPPRAGLGREVLDGLVRLEPKLIVYVSCDPSTLARDMRRLVNAGYSIEQITPFDLFPQTYHIETVGLMSRKDQVK
jgi:23S rRNA (uracil1939-C5)-methyltransferase